MGKLDGIDDAGRQIAGLLGYNPGPGIYSRLERAIEAMPENVRVQELPGLLKRYKDGVPGWELKETDLDSVIAGRDLVPREELLARVKERSPVYTHGEVILGGRPQIQHVPTGGTAYRYDAATDTVARLPDDTRPVPDYQFPDTGEVSRLGQGVSHGEARYSDYGQGGSDYAELLLTQPRVGGDYGSHWSEDTKDAVAHARFDTHGDALRINELQSDLGIHNRKAREAMADFVAGQPIARQRPAPELPFPLEDSWSDLLIKRLALEAARKGHRAIEVASPRAIADKVGGNIENYEHFYGKVVPGALERLGRKMGGLVDDTAGAAGPNAVDSKRMYGHETIDRKEEYRNWLREAERAARAQMPGFKPRWRTEATLAQAVDRIAAGDVDTVAPRLENSFSEFVSHYGGDMSDAGRAISAAWPYLDRAAEARKAWDSASLEAIKRGTHVGPERLPRRYLMSDEMRRRLIEGGIGASLLAPLLMQDGE
jgi:hypothetical protein